MLRFPTVADFSIAREADLAALSFRREPTDEATVARFGIDPNLAPAGEPHYLYPEIGESGIRRLMRKLGRAMGIDQGGDGNVIGNAVITYACQGTAKAGALQWDQFWYFSQIGDAPENNTFAIGTMNPASTAFSNSQVADFLSFQPFCVVNMNLVNASDPSIVSGLQMKPVRLTPFGTAASATVYNLQYQTTVDFQTGRGQIPFSERVDGYTYMRINTPIQAVAGTFNNSWLLGARPDRRAQVPKLPPQVLNSSGAGR